MEFCYKNSCCIYTIKGSHGNFQEISIKFISQLNALIAKFLNYCSPCPSLEISFLDLSHT